MLRSGFFLLAFGFFASTSRADEPKFQSRPISQADSIVFVSHEDMGLFSDGKPKMILAAWPDGHIVWSGNRIEGGAPYRVGQIDPKKITALLTRLDKDGLFDDQKLNDPNFGPDSQFTRVLIKSGKKQVKMESWHEWAEEVDDTVADHHGIRSLEGKRRLEVLRKAPTDYLFFRFVWSETRAKLSDLIPSESSSTAGELYTKAGVLSCASRLPTRRTPRIETGDVAKLHENIRRLTMTAKMAE